MQEPYIIIAMPIPEKIVGLQRIIEHSIISQGMLFSYAVRAWEIRHKVNDEYINIVMDWITEHIYESLDGIDYDSITNGIAEQMMCSIDKANDIIIDTTFAKIMLLLNKISTTLDNIAYHLIDPEGSGYGVHDAMLIGYESMVVSFKEIP